MGINRELCSAGPSGRMLYDDDDDGDGDIDMGEGTEIDDRAVNRSDDVSPRCAGHLRHESCPCSFADWLPLSPS